MMDFTPPQVTAAKTGLKLAAWIIGGVVVGVGIIAVLAFISDPFHIRKNKVERLENQVTAHAGQSKANDATNASSDNTARDVRVIVQSGEKEVRYVQTLPGAETLTDPIRAAGLCASLRRVLGDEAAECTAQSDGKPESAVSDFGGQAR